jgi:hypothetical protein
VCIVLKVFVTLLLFLSFPVLEFDFLKVNVYV